MTLDALRLALIDALGSEGGTPTEGSVPVLADYPEGAEYLAAAPFATLGFRSLELSSLGFGDRLARRGRFAFTLGVYARSAGEAASALAQLSARAQSEGVRALLGSVTVSAGETKPDRDGLVVCEAVIGGEALVATDGSGDAEVIDLHLSATLVGI